ncbi:hypothetical protein SUDANB121_00236 [Nocardiopsis dassonvillei]|uniref:DUF3817 domain-containing protein n=1 Tax=Nocardiopsis dassonvillei TaxID=2014 RepID=UPI003F554216
MNIPALVNAIAFRVIAVVEALTWVGLLAGMYVKYLGSGSERGVEVFGMLHGIAFMLYVAVCLVSAVHLRWGVWPTLLALAASVPPLFTLIADLWLHRSGRLPRIRGAARVPETVG